PVWKTRLRLVRLEINLNKVQLVSSHVGLETSRLETRASLCQIRGILHRPDDNPIQIRARYRRNHGMKALLDKALCDDLSICARCGDHLYIFARRRLANRSLTFVLDWWGLYRLSLLVCFGVLDLLFRFGLACRSSRAWSRLLHRRRLLGRHH